MTIFKGISAARNRLAGWIRDLWSRLLHLNVSIARGYLVVCFLVVLLFALAFGGLRLVENHLVAAIRQDPTIIEAYDDLGRFYWSLGWLRRYEITLKRLASEFPSNPWPRVALAQFDYYLIPVGYALTPEGLNSADKAAQLALGDHKALLSLTQLYLSVGEYARAFRTAQDALVIALDPSEAHFWAGQALKQSGSLEAAELEFQAGASIRTKDEEFSRLSYAELLTATREITITLRADQLCVLIIRVMIRPTRSVQLTDSRGVRQAGHEGIYTDRISNFRVNSLFSGAKATLYSEFSFAGSIR